MIRDLRIAHTSDVHLHEGEGGAQARRAFSCVVDAVLQTQSDLFLIAGDLFDHNRIGHDLIDFVCRELSRVACPTVIIAGNHDCWEDHSVLRRIDFAEAGHHVTLLDEPAGVQIEYPELHASVWGRCMLDHHPGNKPMAGSPPRRRDLWHIGMAHGLYVEDAKVERSSLITAQEIQSSGFDYLALGHVHVHRQMRHGDTLACYPGVPVADYGPREPGCITLVDLQPGKGARAIEHRLGAEVERREVA